MNLISDKRYIYIYIYIYVIKQRTIMDNLFVEIVVRKSNKSGHLSRWRTNLCPWRVQLRVLKLKGPNTLYIKSTRGGGIFPAGPRVGEKGKDKNTVPWSSLLIFIFISISYLLLLFTNLSFSAVPACHLTPYLTFPVLYLLFFHYRTTTQHNSTQRCCCCNCILFFY